MTRFVLQFLMCYQKFVRIALVSSEHLFNKTLHKNYPLFLEGVNSFSEGWVAVFT